MSGSLRILVCVKRVPAPGARISLTDDAQAVDASFLAFTTSPHEECAVEAAVQLIEAHGGETTVLTLGPPEAEEQLRYAVSVGVQKAVLCRIDDNDWEPQRTARAITDSIVELEAADGPFDLVLFGNESADSGGFQVGIRVGCALDRPTVNGAKGLEIVDGTARIERDAEAGRERYIIDLPAVVGVKEGITLPRYPTMKGRLASKKADVHAADARGEPGGQTMVGLRQPPEQASATTMLGEGVDAAAAVVDLLEELGVLG